MKKLILIISLLFAININAGTNTGLGFGPIYAYDTTNETNILGLDLSYTHSIIFTASIQPRVFLEEDSNDYRIDLQLTRWFLFNIGGGFGYQTVDDGDLVSHFDRLSISHIHQQLKQLVHLRNCWLQPSVTDSLDGC